VSRRLSSPLYAGARGRLDLAAASRLGARYVVTPKLDGIYTTVATDSAGRISAIITRNGEFLPKNLAADYAGVRWLPDSVLVCEAECWTEAANRIVEKRGFRLLWAFDALRVAGQDTSKLVYSERRDWLMRGESWLVNESADRTWTTDKNGAAHDINTGRWTRPVGRGWRRVRVVPSMPASKAETAWSEWTSSSEMPVEGLVVCGLKSKLGRGKSKVKALETIDAVVLQSDPSGYVLRMRGSELVFAIGRGGIDAQPDDVVEVAHEGWYTTGVPRFARVVRARPDLRIC